MRAAAATTSRAERTRFDLPLDLPAAPPFQQSCGTALLRDPARRHDQLSARSAAARHAAAVRAVGAAVGRNPLSVIVPCHRVLGRDGSLTGYAGGLERKTALLRLEGADRPE